MARTAMGVPATLLIRFGAVTAWGKTQSFGGTISPGLTATVKDDSGNTSDETLRDHTSVVTVVWKPEAGVKQPTYNDIVQVAGFEDTNRNGPYRVIETSETSTNTDYPDKGITLRRYLENGVPAATTTS